MLLERLLSGAVQQDDEAGLAWPQRVHVPSLLLLLFALAQFDEGDVLAAFDQCVVRTLTAVPSDDYIATFLLSMLAAAMRVLLPLRDIAANDDADSAPAVASPLPQQLAYHALHWTAQLLLLRSDSAQEQLSGDAARGAEARLLRAARRASTEHMSDVVQRVLGSDDTVLVSALCRLLVLLSRPDTPAWHQEALTRRCDAPHWSWSRRVRTDTVFLAYAQALCDKLSRGEQLVQALQLRYAPLLDNIAFHISRRPAPQLLARLARVDDQFAAYAIQHIDAQFADESASRLSLARRRALLACAAHLAASPALGQSRHVSDAAAERGERCARRVQHGDARRRAKRSHDRSCAVCAQRSTHRVDDSLGALRCAAGRVARRSNEIDA